MKLDDKFLEQLRNLRLVNPVTGRKRVLVLDAELDVLKWFRATELSHDHEFTFFLLNDEHEVLEAIRNLRPDIVIIDLNLPNCTDERITEVVKLAADWRLPLLYSSGERWIQRELPRIPRPRPVQRTSFL